MQLTDERHAKDRARKKCNPTHPLARLALATALVVGGSVFLRPDSASAAPPNTTMTPTSGAAYALVGGTEVAVWRGQDGSPWTATGANPVPGSANSLGGQVVGAPDLTGSADGTATLAGLGLDRAAWVKPRAANGSWGPWLSLGGRFLHPPTIASWGAGRLDVFGVGLDSAVWHDYSTDGGAHWSGWHSVGGVATAAPDAASSGPNRVEVVIRGGDGAAWMLRWDTNAWSGWWSLGGRIDGGPGVAAVPASGTSVVVARGADGLTYQRNGVSASAPWVRRDGVVRGDLDAATVGGAAVLVGVGADNRVWTAGSATPWTVRTWADSAPPVDPFGAFDTLGLQYADRVVVSGWAADASDPAATVRVDVVVDGRVTGGANASVSRWGVGAHGFDITAPAAAGARTVCLVARDVGVGDDVVLGCRDIAPPAPGNYAFMATDTRGLPVHFDPCSRIPVVLNTAGGPSWAAQELDAAVAELRRVSGLDIYVEGTTSEPVGLSRTIVDVLRYGQRWSPILVGFSTPSLIPALNGGVVGLGGPSTVSGADGKVFVTGIVILDGPQAAGLPTGWDGPSLRKLMMHELGHVVGLAHVADSSQLMAAIIPSRTGGFGSGDLAGLSWLGSGRACQRTPALPLGIGTASASSIDGTDATSADPVVPDLQVEQLYG